jgi:hypothetical protein
MLRASSLHVVLVAAILAGAACSRQADDSSKPVTETVAAAKPTPGATPPPEPTRPAPTEKANLAAADMGGVVEEVTGSYGAGFMGRRFIDGLDAPTWKLETAPPGEIAYPQEAVISFFEREPAFVDTVQLVLPEAASNAPKDVEVWTSMTSATENFSRRAIATLEPRGDVQEIAFDPVEAKFVKFVARSGVSPQALEIAELRVLESRQPGYTPLFTRAPLVARWKGSPREAAQRGLDWLQQAAPVWYQPHHCFGCHVQAQVLMGQAVAFKHGYRVNMRSVRELYDQLWQQSSWGGWWNPTGSATAFGAMGVTHAYEILGTEEDKKYPYVDRGLQAEAANRLLESQREDGSQPVDELAPPIVQGSFMTTANALVALTWAAEHSADARYKASVERALAWIASHEPETTQDKIFKVIALMHYGTPDQKRSAWAVVETLAAEQEADGGWKEDTSAKGSNAFATGQVLYAFKQAGVSVHGDMFRRGVQFLLGHQINDPAALENGSWAAMNTASERPSGFAHTMWAVIGLAGAYGPEPTGALRIVRQQGEQPPARNLEVVLDVSGSMNTKLGDTTRWKTALGVLDEVLDALPDDMNVALRVYGHRQSSKSPKTCTDTELVVPIARLDRERIRKAAARLKPRGETPLVRSVLQTIEDLKAAGGGSVILITDGEESCGGDAKAAAAQFEGSSVNVALNIVGFTLTGEKVAAELGQLAESTGGRYYSAQDGAQLSRAVKLAALNRLPYDVLDATGQKVLVSGQTSELSRELAPGKYRIRIDALGQVLEDSLTIAANETTLLGLGVEEDRFVIRPTASRNEGGEPR